MKTTKIFIGVFFLAFLFGTTVFYLVPKTERRVEQVEVIQAIPADYFTPKIEIKTEPELLEENNDWQNENKSKFKIKLLETGEGFHGDEIKAKSGEVWLGLFKENNRCFLRSTKIKIRRVHDPIVDGYDEKEAAQKTGKSVSANEKSKPLFLVKNAKQLSEGEAESLFWMNLNDLAEDEFSDASSLNKDFVRDYDFNGINYNLSVKSGINKKGENIIALVLKGDGKTQVLHSLKSFEDGDYLGSVYFVGDLDRDNKPDFYFDLYFQDNVEYKNLFISSKAEKEKLVKKVATFSITGC